MMRHRVALAAAALTLPALACAQGPPRAARETA